MFSISVQKLLPLQCVEINALWVRGALGEIAVYASKGGHKGKHEDPSQWKMVYKSTHEPSPGDLVELKLGTIDEDNQEEIRRKERERQRRLAALTALREMRSHGDGAHGEEMEIHEVEEPEIEEDEEDEEPVVEISQDTIKVRPGEKIGLYIHSKRPDDKGIVYDNQKADVTHADKYIKVLPGLSHLSNQAFFSSQGWPSWRKKREFVGKVVYSCKYKLWAPRVHHRYPRKFRAMARTMLLVHKSMDKNSCFSIVPSECLLYILNMCHWGWAGELDEDEGMVVTHI